MAFYSLLGTLYQILYYTHTTTNNKRTAATEKHCQRRLESDGVKIIATK